VRTRAIGLIWGLILIAVGGVYLAQNLGYIPELPLNLWMIATAALSVLFFATYFVSGRDQFGWLFPAFILAGTAITLFLVESGADGSFIGAPILVSIALPFLVVFFLNRKENWWALIPAWVLSMLALITLISDRVSGDLMGTVVMLAIGIPFLVVYLVNREHWWALIPAGIMLALAVIVLIASRASGEIVAPLILFAIALPFFVVYVRSAENWWALIPAGILASIGLTIFLAGRAALKLGEANVFNGVALLGFAATFGILWLRHRQQETAWAIYPAIILALASVAAFIWGAGMDLFWPILLIAGGALILFVNLRRR
jgi:hypothetical protein